MIQMGYHQLKKREFGSAAETFKKSIEEEGEQSVTLIGLLLCEKCLSDEGQLPSLPQPLSGYPLFRKAMENASEEYRKTLEEYLTLQKKELEAKENKYNILKSSISKKDKTEGELSELIGLSIELKGYKEADAYQTLLQAEKQQLEDRLNNKKRKRKKVLIPVIAVLAVALLTVSFFFVLPKREGIRYVLTLNGYDVFSCDDDLEKAVVREELFGITVSGVGDKAFKDREKLQEVVLHEGITSIGKSAFSGCTALTRLTGTMNVKTVKNKAFKSCISLQMVVFGENCTFGNNSFKNCSKFLMVMAGEQRIDLNDQGQ